MSHYLIKDISNSHFTFGYNVFIIVQIDFNYPMFLGLACNQSLIKLLANFNFMLALNYMTV